MRILVLGAGGFIGRHIVGDLLDAGHEVVGTARSTDALSRAFTGDGMNDWLWVEIR